ncbi:twin-arginine translocase TatA/TatE family subunit [Paraglaciecola hydrolytica]|uniref:Sec-independent protein translocase protein TatA n=1 Tax=Paraglaciecola hydrolytica TaxID=1799789 RepID=A0A136A3V4_9ALTE|nr:twin-arginine translocase TatA/TatE family subunit [Paraglaciecola hydrolytica]KXI29897.1 preprotein translocase subunit TatA [Paraglaciecola hydrolytica]
MFGISVPQLLIILGIIVLLFGTKKLRSLGGDLGSAVKGFKKAISDDKDEESKDADADFATKEKVENKSKAAESVNQTKTSEQKERN